MSPGRLAALCKLAALGRHRALPQVDLNWLPDTNREPREPDDRQAHHE
jgi:hypothetical protein